MANIVDLRRGIEAITIMDGGGNVSRLNNFWRDELHVNGRAGGGSNSRLIKDWGYYVAGNDLHVWFLGLQSGAVLREEIMQSWAGTYRTGQGANTLAAVETDYVYRVGPVLQGLISENTRLIAYGHSIGGVYAYLAVLQANRTPNNRIPHVLITYGSPAYCREGTAGVFVEGSRSAKVYNYGDPVTELPEAALRGGWRVACISQSLLGRVRGWTQLQIPRVNVEVPPNGIRNPPFVWTPARLAESLAQQQRGGAFDDRHAARSYLLALQDPFEKPTPPTDPEPDIGSPDGGQGSRERPVPIVTPMFRPDYPPPILTEPTPAVTSPSGTVAVDGVNHPGVSGDSTVANMSKVSPRSRFTWQRIGRGYMVFYDDITIARAPTASKAKRFAAALTRILKLGGGLDYVSATEFISAWQVASNNAFQGTGVKPPWGAG